MRVFKNHVLIDIDGNPLVDQSKRTLTLCNVLVNCAMTDAAPNMPRFTARQVADRAVLSVMLNKVALEQEFQLSDPEVRHLIEDCCRLYPPSVTYRVLEALAPEMFKKEDASKKAN